MKLRRLALILCLIAALCLPAHAADSYTEHREPPQAPTGGPTFTETEISCQSGENTLRGVLTLPEGDGPFPVAILLHGLATDHTWCDDIAWILGDHGIASVRFDFAGTGLSGGAQEDMTLSTEVRDTVAILDYVESQSWTDQSNIFMVGKSMGGVDALLASVSRQDEVKALVLWYPGFSVTESTRRGMLLGEWFFPWDPPEGVTVSGYTFGREFIREAQVLDYASYCRRYPNPVMILHGSLDFIVPLVSSLSVQDEFPDCTLKVYPGGMHGFWGFQELEALSDMLAFLQAQIT